MPYVPAHPVEPLEQRPAQTGPLRVARVVESADRDELVRVAGDHRRRAESDEPAGRCAGRSSGVRRAETRPARPRGRSGEGAQWTAAGVARSERSVRVAADDRWIAAVAVCADRLQ